MTTPLLLLASLTATSQGLSTPLLIGEVAIHGDQIVFSWHNRLWSVPASGGEAKRLLADDRFAAMPVFSPDGKWIAFSSGGGGDVDVYVVPAGGGESRQITWHPKMDVPRAWSPDGKRILFASGREKDGSMELYETSVERPWETRLPIPRASFGTWLADGSVVYSAKALSAFSLDRRNYRGGNTGPLRILDPQSGKVRQVGEKHVNNVLPITVGKRLFTVSDSGGSFNLVEIDLQSGKPRPMTTFKDKGIVWASGGGGSIAFVHDGRIHRLDPESGRTTVVEVRIPADAAAQLDARAPKKVAAMANLTSASLSGDGKTLVLESRGEVLIKSGATPIANLTRSSTSAERFPVLSPDARRVAYFSDEQGEYGLCISDRDVSNRTLVRIEEKPSFYRELSWSPDGRRLVFSDIRNGLWIVEDGKPRRIDVSPHFAQGLYHPSWSPDGSHLAYSKALANRVRTIFVWDTRAGKATQLTDGLAHCEFPTFDRGGRYLYFSGSGNARNASAYDIDWALESSRAADPLVIERLCIVTLRRDDPPAMPRIGKILKDPAADFRIDWDGIRERIYATAYEADIENLISGRPGEVIAHVQHWGSAPGLRDITRPLFRVDAGDVRGAARLLEDCEAYEVSADGSTILTLTGRGLQTLSSSEGEKASSTVDLSQDKIDVDPRQEYVQMFDEAVRMMRDHFYDPGYHGQDLDALTREYRAYLPGILDRGALNTLLSRLFGEVSVSHLQVGGGDARGPSGSPLRVGLLGADFEAVGGRYRIARIMEPAYFLMPYPTLRSPLSLPGVDAKSGEYLLSVEGVSVTTDRNLFSYFAGRAMQPTKLTIGPSADGAGAREVTVVPLPGENILRALDVAERNRRWVEEVSNGQLAYVFIGGYDSDGHEGFYRVLNASAEKKGLIIDQRFNGGGITSDSMIEALMRSPRLSYFYRYGHGADFQVPGNRIDGPKVLITNEANGSAAETFALMFKAMKLGKVVGTRTYGGGIGVALYQPRLIDGGVIGIPNRAAYNPLTGQWEVENEGVRPDVEVDLSPESYRSGRDPQLEAAVRVAMEEIKRYRKPALKRPKGPVMGG